MESRYQADWFEWRKKNIELTFFFLILYFFFFFFFLLLATDKKTKKNLLESPRRQSRTFSITESLLQRDTRTVIVESSGRPTIRVKVIHELVGL